MNVYPSMRHYLPNPAITGIVVRSEAQDKALGEGWDDPYGLRIPKEVVEAKARVEEIKIELEEIQVARKPGRPRKVKP
jgi:hypothetical protein